MRRLLITGGAGFIGVNFVRYWHARHPQDRLVVLDALTYAGNRDSLHGLDEAEGFRFVRGNIGDESLVERLLREERIDTVVHFAAESHVDRSILGPDAFLETNVIGTHTLLKAARTVWLDRGSGQPHRFHHVSTDEVYGSLGPNDPPFSETTAYAPNSPYSASKAASDHLVRAYHHTYGLDVTTSNCSNNYGPYQFPEKLIPLFLINALRGEPLPIYGDGRNVRDWLFVEDHCRAIEMILEEGTTGEVYNVGGECELANLELIDRLCREVDKVFRERPDLGELYPKAPAGRGDPTSSLRIFVKDRPGHDQRYAIDTRKISNDLGFQPSVTLGNGLNRTIRWYLDEADWWRRVLDGSYRDWIRTHYGD